MVTEGGVVLTVVMVPRWRTCKGFVTWWKGKQLMAYLGSF